MLSVTLPCPACSAPLILDGENAGEEAICPGCEAHLRLPGEVSATGVVKLLQSTDSEHRISSGAGSKPQPMAGKAALPQSRSKSVEDERKRLAAAAAAAGGANSFQPDEAALPADRRPAVLPSKRTLTVPSQEPADTVEKVVRNEAAPPRPPSGFLPTKRTPGAPLDPHSPVITMQPMEPREDIEISAAPTRGPSRFVKAEHRAEGANAPTAPPAQASGETENASEAADDASPAARGGFRLGAGRELHFSPAPTVDADGEATAWGAKAETPAQAARGRRFVSLAVAIALLLAGGGGIYMMRQAFANTAPTADPEEETGIAAAAPAENVMRNVEDARRVLKRFLGADSLDLMTAEVRHPEASRPRMERFYGSIPIKPRKIKSESQSWNEIRIGDKEFIRAFLELDDFKIYPVTLELISGSEPKVDWESFASWAELPWKDFLRTPPEQAVDYRVTVTLDPRDQYYNYSFKGRELDLLCFKLEDPERYGSCWGYTDKDSEVASQLLFHLKRSRQRGVVNDEGKIAISCILKLRFPPEGRKTNQVMIEKFVNENWVQP